MIWWTKIKYQGYLSSSISFSESFIKTRKFLHIYCGLRKLLLTSPLKFFCLLQNSDLISFYIIYNRIFFSFYVFLRNRNKTILETIDIILLLAFLKVINANLMNKVSFRMENGRFQKFMN